MQVCACRGGSSDEIADRIYVSEWVRTMKIRTLRFRFELTGLDGVEPWGKSQRLHWFGLTEGRYWIEFDEGGGSDRLSAAARSQEAELACRAGKGVDYYVGRFWEDLIQLTAGVLEPVPGALSQFIASFPEDWRPVESEEAWEAVVWHGRHVLDLSYLAQPAYVCAWRTITGDVDEVTLTWRHSLDGNMRIIEGARGCVKMPTTCFVDAVRQMDAEFMDSMNGRLAEVGSSVVGYSGGGVDMRELRQEQLSRSAWLTQRLEAEPGTDWNTVTLGARQLLR